MFRKKTVKGSVLAYALVMMTVVSILLVSILSFIVSQIQFGSYTVAREQSFQAAEQGIQFYKWYLAHQTDGRTVQQIESFWASGTAYGVDSEYVANVTDPSGGVMGTFRINVTPPTSGSTIVSVESTGEMTRYPGKTRTIKVRFRRPSWSESAALSNEFIRFGSGTEVFGKIQSNQGIRFDGYAHNVVSSAVATTNDPDHSGGVEFGVHTHMNVPVSSGENDAFRPLEAPPNVVPARTDVFAAGRQFPISSVDFNGVIGDLSYMKTESQSGHGNYFAALKQGRQIILRTDDTFDVCTVNTYSVYDPYDHSGTNGITGYLQNSGTGTCGTCSGACLRNYAIPQNGIIFVEGNIWLSGKVNGRKVAVVAANLSGTGLSKSVFIPSDLRYTNYDGTDVIGVIGQLDVEIPRDSSSTLRIDAALIAKEGRVGREYYSTWFYYDTKNSITIYGALATNKRYGFAYTDDTGYITRNLYYDNNLLYFPPPYFPTGTRYLIDLWEEL